MSKILSTTFIGSFFRSIQSSVFTFPREIAISIVSAIAFMVQVESTDDTKLIAMHIGLIGIIALATSLASTVAVRSTRMSTIQSWIAWIVVTIPLGWFVYGLDFAGDSAAFQYGYLVILVHLLVIASWMLYGSIERYWNGVTAMFYRLLLSLLFTSLLLTGLSSALLAVQLLFDLDPYSNLVFHVSIASYFIFNTLFFLAGIPTRETIEAESLVPRTTMVLSKFVLAPVIGIFLVILYAYGIKVLTESVTESVSGFVLWLSGATIFTALITWPMRKSTELLWSALHRYAPLSIAPLIILAIYAWATYLMKNEIGPDSFTVAVLLAVSTITIAYWIVRRELDPRAIVIIASIALIITTAGPIGVGAVSASSDGNHSATTSEKGSANVVEYYRSIEPTFTIDLDGDSSVWTTTFSVLEAPPSSDGNPVVVHSDDSLTTISLSSTSSLVTITSRAFQDTIMFDARKLLSDSSTTLQPIIEERSRYRTTILCTRLILKKRNGVTFVYGITGTTYSSRQLLNL